MSVDYMRSVENAITHVKKSVRSITDFLLLNAEIADEFIEMPVTQGMMTSFLRGHSGLSQLDAASFEESVARLVDIIKTCSLPAKEFYLISGTLIRQEKSRVKRNLRSNSARILKNKINDQRILIRKKIAEAHLEIIDGVIELTVKIYHTKREFELINEDDRGGADDFWKIESLK